ncbi:PEP-CTERM sorting domain-containing protein [Verrucomicrobiaceae bacterium N1E253]|uniref:PEP-CTERM sorting domain-containing protein n=1 Tax=Oceaniferula marina TaxID=2748318 RepID=A0A851GIX1_9BACT|nr:PEP-CTERM sorting domain-containing protein [Oceaniferula marina]NWK55067.1 PEP-CTERM sorting domain-containing protein [Oceaniferula marina]
MKKTILLSAALLAGASFVNAATTITVLNAGFETQTVADGQNNSQSSTSFYDATTSNSGDGTITGWTESNTTTQLGYVINPGSGFTQPTEGNNAALVMNQTISQNLGGFILNTGDTVTVEFDVWRGNAGNGSTLLINFAGLGTQAASGVTQSISSQSFNFVITSDGVTTGDLSFQSTIGGNDYRIDNIAVSYTAVPEPSSTALLGLGGIALILRRRK